MLQLVTAAPLAATRAAPTATRGVQGAGTGFADLFAKQLQSSREVKFSAHALQRLRERNITLTTADKANIGRALDAAATKGARETLLLMNRTALVASVPNRTVITAVPLDGGDDSVFTNIDSAVVVGSSETASAKTETIGPDPFGGSLFAAD